MPIVDDRDFAQPTLDADRNRADPNAEKPTKALVGIALLVAIGFAMYGLGTKQPGADTPAQVMARNVQR